MIKKVTVTTHPEVEDYCTKGRYGPLACLLLLVQDNIPGGYPPLDFIDSLTGEEVIEIANYKVVYVKEKTHIIAFMIGFSDPIQRTIEIARNVLYIATSMNKELLNLRKLVEDLYPLDLPR